MAKGKHEELALIVVCNTLLKQAFAFTKSGLKCNAEYKSMPVKN
jgi:hypothetical protein